MFLRAIILVVFVFIGPAQGVLGQLPSDDQNINIWPERSSRSNADRRPLARKNVWIFEYREAVSPATEGVSGLTNIIPPADYLEASSLSRRNRAGFEMDRFRYGSSLPVLANTTYALRSTSNKRADLLVAFRVVSVAADGDVTILWRKLKTYPKPSWKRREE